MTLTMTLSKKNKREKQKYQVEKNKSHGPPKNGKLYASKAKRLTQPKTLQVKKMSILDTK